MEIKFSVTKEDISEKLKFHIHGKDGDVFEMLLQAMLIDNDIEKILVDTVESYKRIRAKLSDKEIKETREKAIIKELEDK